MAKIIVITSISGSGKTTLVNLAESQLGIKRLRTCTTRAVRAEETGDEYYFMSENDFQSHVANDDFVEYSQVYDHHYGLLKSEVTKNANGNSIIILDVQGMHKIKALYDNVVTVFIRPPSILEIKSRLLARNTSKEDVDRRISEIMNEMKHIDEFDYDVKSGSLEQMSASFTALMKRIMAS